MRSPLTGGALAFAFLLALGLTLRAHDHWISRERLVDPVNGEWCCSEDDCDLLPEDGVSSIPGGYHIASTNEDIPRERVIWRSGDGRWWRCRYLAGEKKGLTRCLIGPPPGS